MSLNYLPKDDSRRDNVYKYSPFRNLGPQKPYEEMDNNERRQNDNREKYEGQIFHTAQGYNVEIVDYMSYHSVMVRFVHDGLMKLSDMNTIKRGLVWYPLEKNQYGGYAGIGNYNQRNSKSVNSIWYNMLQRATPEFWSISKYKKYEGTTICDAWYNFQNFASWYYYYMNFLNPDVEKYRYQLDKDVLQWGQSNKMYSPYTCSIIPKTLNAALEGLDRTKKSDLPKGVDYLGPDRYCSRCSYGTSNTNGVYLGTFKTAEEAFLVYKKEKENYIRTLAHGYLTEGAIILPVYEAICKIEIKPYGI